MNCTVAFDELETSRYIKNPVHCPHCYSTHISSNGFDSEIDFVTTVVTCSDCLHKWVEIYNLVAIEPHGFDPCSTEEPF